GIMFPIKCKDLLPIDHLVIKSISVRGRLGPLTVWVSKNQQNQNSANAAESTESSAVAVAQGRRASRRRNPGVNHLRVDRVPDSNRTRNSIDLHPRAWNKLFDRTVKASFREYQELVLDTPIRLKPGESRVLYIHSTLPGDEAIVYDNAYYGATNRRFEDDKLAILTGRAHVSTECFGTEPIWGWGNPWRDRREFVGRLAYGTVYKLWNPEVAPKFGGSFQDGARALLMCQRRWESPWSVLPDECVYYILNMCRWDWFNDCPDTMKERRRRERAKQLLAPAAVSTSSTEEDQDQNMEDSKPSASESCCGRVTRSRAHAAGTDSAGAMDGLEDVDRDDDDDDDMEAEDSGSDEAEEEDGEDEEDANSDAWSEESDDEDQYHTANRRQFSFDDIDSDADEDDNPRETDGTQRNAWIRRQFARIHVLRALANIDDQAVDAEDQDEASMDS
ncbi:MAG: hypothetical protein SGILL_004023, partial [Bacillariaceae sp.]